VVFVDLSKRIARNVDEKLKEIKLKIQATSKMFDE
jgi:hypothetical protein